MELTLITEICTIKIVYTHSNGLPQYFSAATEMIGIKVYMPLQRASEHSGIRAQHFPRGVSIPAEG